jgi:hypothetical protein
MCYKFLGFIWPRQTYCPECKCGEWAKSGVSRAGRIQYRRCAKCGLVYKVLPIGEHFDNGGDQSGLKII